MMTKIQIGNLDRLLKQEAKHRGWAIGRFIDQSSFRYSQECEVKWMHHKKGIENLSRLDTSRYSRTVVILISGKWQLKFSSSKTVTLSKMGDFIACGPEPHTSKALKDSVVMAIRWYPKKK